MMKYLIVLVALLWPVRGWAENHYVAAAQQGDGSGVSCSTAKPTTFFNTQGNWNTNDAADGKIGPNDTVYLCDDGGSFTPTINYGSPTKILYVWGSGSAGKPITITPSSGESPLFDGGRYFTAGDWTDNGGSVANTWYASVMSPIDGKFVMFGADSAANVGIRETAVANLNAAREYYYDVAGNRIYVYSAGAAPSALTISHTQYAIYGAGVDYINITGITAKHFSSQAIGGIHVSYWNINENNVSWGGGTKSGANYVGNGIQIGADNTGDSTNNNISYNTVTQYFDSGIAYQSFGSGAVTNGRIDNNNISYCGGGIEYNATNISTGGARDGVVELNNLTYLGYGWSGWSTYANGGNSLHGSGVVVSGGAAYPVSGVHVRDNYIDTFTFRGISNSQTAGANYYYRNRIKNGAPTWTGDPPGGIVAHGGTAGNTSNDALGSIFANQISATTSHGIYVINNDSTLSIANNTLVDTAQNGTTYFGMASIGSLLDTWSNNLCSSQGVDSICVVDESTKKSTYSNNLYHNSSGGAVARYAGSNYTSAAAWNTARSGDDAGSLSLDPLFVNAPAGNFGLRANSPARGAGTGTKVNGQPADIGACQTSDVVGAGLLYGPCYPLASGMNAVTIP